MTPGSVEVGQASWPVSSPPVLVLGVGNTLLSDDGAGPAMLAELQRGEWGGSVEFLDGGTQGLALLGRLAGRRALVVLDAVALGAEPGTVHTLREWNQAGVRGSTAHESNVAELLQTSMLLGDCPAQIAVIGIEPARLTTGIGLSEAVARAMPGALEEARRAIAEFLMTAAAL